MLEKKNESEGSGAGLQWQQLQATKDWRRKEIKVDTVASGTIIWATKALRTAEILLLLCNVRQKIAWAIACKSCHVSK